MTLELFTVMMFSNNDLILIGARMFQQWPQFLLLLTCAPTITLGAAGSVGPKINVTDIWMGP
jgi:hypothetical protein